MLNRTPTTSLQQLNHKAGASKMALWVEELAVKPDYQSLVAGVHRVGKTNSHKLYCDFIHRLWHMRAHTHMHIHTQREVNAIKNDKVMSDST